MPLPGLCRVLAPAPPFMGFSCELCAIVRLQLGTLGGDKPTLHFPKHD